MSADNPHTLAWHAVRPSVRVCFAVRSIWGVIFSLQGTAAVYAALEVGYQMPGKCAAVNAVGASRMHASSVPQTMPHCCPPCLQIAKRQLTMQV